MLAVLALGAIALVAGQEPLPGVADRREAVQQRTVPGLEAALNDVTSFTVATKNNRQSVTIERSAETRRWQVREMDGYPADMQRVLENLLGLARSVLIEQKTAKAENYPKLQIDDAQAIRWTVRRGADIVADVWIGRTSDREKQTFLRYPGDPRVWLVSGALRPFVEPKEWIRQEVLDIAPARVKQIVIHHPAGDLTIARPSVDAEIVVSPLPERPNSSLIYMAQTALRSLAHATLSDVMAQSSLTGSLPDQVTLTTFDGLTLVLRYVAANKGTQWLTITAETAPGAAPRINDEAAAINARTAGWAYTLGSYTMSQFNLTPDDLTNFHAPRRVD